MISTFFVKKPASKLHAATGSFEIGSKKIQIKYSFPVMLAISAYFATAVTYGQNSWAADPGRNMVVDAENVPVELTEKNLLWEIDSGTGRQYPMVAIAKDKVLIGGNGNGNPDPYWDKAMNRGGSLVCRRLSDGKQLWRLVSPDNGREAGFGICGSPLVIGDRVYVHAVNHVYCLDLEGMANGNQGITNELELMTRSPFRPVEGKPRPTEAPEWAADVIWHFSFNDMKVRPQDAISCTPLVTNGQVWISTAHEMGSRARGDKDKKKGEWKPHPPAPHLLVLDQETGELIAKDNMDVPVVWHGEWSSPSAVTVNGETIVIFGDGYGLLHGFALPEKSGDGVPVILEELWTMDLNPREYRFDEQGREHPYSLDIRLIYKYPLGWLRDPDKWILPPEDWASYKGKVEGETSYQDLPLDKVNFKNRRKSDKPGPGKHNGPAELIAMPVVVKNRVYLAIGRDYTYSGGNVPENRKVESSRSRRFTEKGRFMCLEFEDAKKVPKVLWEDRDLAHTQSNASVHEGLVYVVDFGGFLNCWNADTGEVVYKKDIGASVRERSQIVSDGKIFVANDLNDFMVFRAGPEPELIAKSEVKHWISTPCPADGVIVFTTDRRVFAYRSTEKE